MERAITILDVLAAGGWRTGAEIARELDVHRSTALRLLGTLERHALVERDPRSAKYRLGQRLAQLASVVTGESDLRSSGKVIIAFGPPAVRERLLGGRLERSTPHTITGRAELEAQLVDALKDGFARTYEELEVGLDAIAAPVFASSGEVVAAVDVSGPSHRLRAEGRPELVRLTLDAAADLSRRLGFRGSRAALTAG